MTIKIFLVDDRHLMREGIKAILKDEPKIEIVGMAKDGIDAIAQVQNLKPDIVLLDIEMPKMDGISVTRHISQFLSDTKVIILSSHGDRSYISEALEAGASSYLLKDSLVKDLKRAIYALSQGYSYIESKLLNQAMNQTKIDEGISTAKQGENSSPNSPSDWSINIQDANSKPATEIHRVDLAPIHESSPEEIHIAQRISENSQPLAYPVTANKKRFPKKLLWLISAIAALILSIIIF